MFWRTSPRMLALSIAAGLGFWWGLGAAPTKDKYLRLGDEAPDFVAKTTQGTLHFHEWMGQQWTILLSHPRAFTPVCSTELGVAALFQKQFAERNTKLLALSIDDLESQNSWVHDINTMQNTAIEFPLVADADRSISRLFGMISHDSKHDLTVRSVFIIDPQKKIRLRMDYPASTGRNFAEILRALDSLQINSERALATPANWQKGDKLIIPADVSNEEAHKKFANGLQEVTPYLRYTAD